MTQNYLPTKEAAEAWMRLAYPERESWLGEGLWPLVLKAYHERNYTAVIVQAQMMLPHMRAAVEAGLNPESEGQDLTEPIW